MKKNSIRKAAQRAVPVLERCELCGAENVPLQRHHTDYSKPTEVMILCTKCHAKMHPRAKKTVRCAVCGKEFYPKWRHTSTARICDNPACKSAYGRVCAMKRWDKQRAATA